MRLQVLDSQGAYLVGFAKKKLNQLEELRKSIGVPFLSKKFKVDSYTVHVKAHQLPWQQVIRIEGGVSPDLLLSGLGGTWFFNYPPEDDGVASGKVKRISSMTGAVHTGSATLNLQDSRNVIHTKNSNGRTYEIDAFKWAGFNRLNNVLTTLDDLDFYALYAEGWEKIASLESSAEPYSFRPGGKRSLSQSVQFINMLQIENDGYEETWNWVSSTYLSAINTSTPVDSYNMLWRWTPRLWRPELGNYMFLTQNFFYGYHLAPEGPFYEAEAHFKGILDCRSGAQHRIGYAECLGKYIARGDDNSEVEGYGTRIYFIPELWEPPNNHFFDWKNNRTWFQHNYWDTTPQHLFFIDCEQAGMFDGHAAGVDVHWWSTKDIPPPEYALKQGYRPNHGIVLVDSYKTWALYNFTGGIEGIAKAMPNYIEHSVSSDGSQVCVVYKNFEKKLMALIYDIGFWEEDEDGNKVPGGRGKSLYLGEIPTLTPEDVESCAFITLPKNKKDALIPYPPKEMGGVIKVPEYRAKHYEPALFGMTHPEPPGKGVGAKGWKLVVDGDWAKIFEWKDECWQRAKYTRHDGVPDGDLDYSKVSKLIYAGGMDGKHATTGGFEGHIGEFMYPTPGGESEESPSSIIMQRQDVDFSLGSTPYRPCFTPSLNSKGPVEYSGDVTIRESQVWVDCYIPAQTCSEVATVTMTDSCGEKAKNDFLVPLKELVVSYDKTDQTFNVAGGKAPYSIDFCGTLEWADEIQGTFKVKDFGGCAKGSHTVTATDDCGNEATDVFYIEWLELGSHCKPEKDTPYTNDACSPSDYNLQYPSSPLVDSACYEYVAPDCRKAVVSFSPLLCSCRWNGNVIYQFLSGVSSERRDSLQAMLDGLIEEHGSCAFVTPND